MYSPFRRAFCFALLCSSALVLLTANTFAQTTPRTVRVVVLCGQSNMAGGTGMVTRTAWPQVWFDDSSASTAANTDWGGLKLPADGGDGVQAGVAEAVQALFPDDQIAVLKVSQGATGISFWMTPGSSGYNALTARIQAARNRLAAQQAAGEIAGYAFEGFFWMQGEAEMDAWNTDGTKRYFQYLHSLASLVRESTRTPALPLVLGRTSILYAPSTIRAANGDFRVYPKTGSLPFAADSEFINSDVLRGHAIYEGFSDSVRTAQIGWTLYDPHSAWVDADDLPAVDYFHFPSGDPGKITLGRRMGRALIRLDGGSTADELKLDAGPHRWVHPGIHTLTATVTSGPSVPASVQWTRVVGNATATIGSPASLTTNVTITEPGTYSFQVVATDGSLRHAGTVNLYVLPEGSNLPAYGSSPVFYVPHPGVPVTLVPNITNPDADALTYTWSQQSATDPAKRFGQGKLIIDSTTIANPTVTFTWPGAQILRLQVSDGTSRPDGNASGWINVPVFVGTEGSVFPDYAARWSFNEPTYLLAEMNETAPQQLNSGVAQSPDTPLGGGSSGVFNGSSYLRNHIGHWDSSVLFLRPFTACSLAMWVNPDAPATGAQVLYEEGGSSQDSSFTLRLNNGSLQAGIYQGGTLYTVEAPAPDAGAWSHVAFTYDGAAGAMRLWINGQNVATTTGLPSSIAKRSLASATGARLQQDAWNATGSATDAADFFRGKLDEVRLYERTLDSSAINALYEQGVVVTPGGTVSLSASSASAAENAGSVTLTVRRTTGTVGAASVDFATSDGSAVAGPNYTSTNGTLNWADGESANKTITVPVLDNAVYAGNKTFTVTLTNSTGALLGSPNSATVTIIENEAVNTAPQIAAVSPSGSQTRIATGAAGLFFDTAVTDDGLSGQAVTLAWTTVSGPAGAVFSQAGDADTSASFPVDGTYVVRLTASDGLLTATRDFTIVAGGTPGSGDGPTSGLILRYKFDEGSGTTIGDSAGNHTVTGFGNATWTPLGKSGSGYNIGGTGNRSFSPSNQTDLNFNPQADEFTVSTWVKSSSTNTYSHIFAKNALSGSNLQYRLWSPSAATKLQGNCGNAQSLEYTTSSPALNDGNWHLVTFVNFNSSGTWKTRVYYDNATKVLEWNSGSGGLVDGLLKIGASSSGSNSWSGQLDDFRIYNRALSQTEVSELYAADSTNFAPFVSAATPAPVQAGSPANLDGTVTDDGLPNPPATVTTLWEKASGPGHVTFGNASAVDTTATADAPGTYVLLLRANDGAAIGAAQVTLTVTQPPGYASWAAGIAWGAADSSATADPDGDGLANFLEYALDGSPLMAMDAPAPAVDISGLRVQVSFLRARAELTYTVQGSSDLSAWSDISYSPVATGQIQTVLDTVDMGAAQPRRFLRLRVSQ
jgi:hypothetical protein